MIQVARAPLIPAALQIATIKNVEAMDAAGCALQDALLAMDATQHSHAPRYLVPMTLDVLIKGAFASPTSHMPVPLIWTQTYALIEKIVMIALLGNNVS